MITTELELDEAGADQEETPADGGSSGINTSDKSAVLETGGFQALLRLTSSMRGTALVSDDDYTSLAGAGGEKDSQSPGKTKWVMDDIKKLEQIEG